MVKQQHKPGLVIIIIALIAITAIVIGATVWGSTLYFNQQYANEHDGCMPGQPNHKVVIQNDTVSPSNTVGLRCQTLTITNLDDIQREVAFGPHEGHVAYDGIKEELLTKGQSLTVTLVQTGNFRFHDHEHDEVQGTFTVQPEATSNAHN
ncbi:MAG: hypothetical protein JWN26_816 [Candidatus Saccharibacteria bacterium]|nr:hypothetical protein [Candidatus Saccharibacteria bacterium]